MVRLALAVLALASCATPQPKPADIVPGELIVRAEDPEAITTEWLGSAAGRDDFVVKSKECLPTSCRVVVERVGGVADAGWTRALIDAIARSKVAGLKSVEPNVVHQVR